MAGGVGEEVEVDGEVVRGDEGASVLLVDETGDVPEPPSPLELVEKRRKRKPLFSKLSRTAAE